MGPTGPVHFTFYHVVRELPARTLRSQHRPNMPKVMGCLVVEYKSYYVDRLDGSRYHVASKLAGFKSHLGSTSTLLLPHHHDV